MLDLVLVTVICTNVEISSLVDGENFIPDLAFFV